ncbi:MAG: hypothetical protein ACLFPS_08240 [Clostridia bacterium]
MFEIVSCLGTVVLSMGTTSTSAPLGIIWTQIIGMILGRLEFFIIFFTIIKIFDDFKYLINNKN